MLSKIKYGDGIGERAQTAFYGLNHTPAAGDGEIFDCENLSSRNFPLLCPRKKRRTVRTLTKANGLTGGEALIWADGTEFFYNGIKKGNVSDSFKSFFTMEPWVIIWPDKAYYNKATDSFGFLEEKYISGAGQISFLDGTYAGKPAKANTITTTGTAFVFEVGDAVTVSGCSVSRNNSVFIIREISEDKKTLRFYENAFSLSGTSFTEPGAITLERKVPDLDFLCENENRLWGVKGDEIFCCKLGNPKVWSDYDNLADSCWSVPTGSSGDFTGIVSFLSYPLPMKETCLHKVHGSVPSDFQATVSATGGVMNGCQKSFAVAGETLFYRSREGVVRYSGGYPYVISQELGEYVPSNAVAGSDGRRYYISGNVAGGSILLCYDTQTKTWHREDSSLVGAFATVGGNVYGLIGNNIVRLFGEDGTGTEEAQVLSFCQFAEFYEQSMKRKGISAIKLRAELEAAAEIKVLLSHDGGAFKPIGTITASGIHRLPCIVERCDFWQLRIEGSGDYKIYAVGRDYYSGSDEH